MAAEMDSAPPRMNAFRTRCRVLAAAALCLCLPLSLGGLGGAGAEEEGGELADLRQQIRQGKTALDRVRRGEASVLEVLDEITAALSRKQRQLDTLNAGIRQRQRELEQAVRSADEASAAFEKGRTALTGRVRALYRWQRAGTPFVLLNGDLTVPELMRRTRHLETVLGRDRRLIRQLSRSVRRRQDQRRSVEALRQDLSEERDAVAALRDTLAAEQARRQETLRSLRRERALREQTLAELERAAGRLQGIIAGSENGRQGGLEGGQEGALERGPAFAASGGGLELPVAGRIVSGFGSRKHPELNVDVHRPGIDIIAPVGAEIRAVEGGRVLYADRLSGYGEMVIIDHGKRYYTVYGHLSRLDKGVGDRVERGERIAWVGGPASSGQSRLYFEVRKNGKPVDPIPWFRRSARHRR